MDAHARFCILNQQREAVKADSSEGSDEQRFYRIRLHRVIINNYISGIIGFEIIGVATIFRIKDLQ